MKNLKFLLIIFLFILSTSFLRASQFFVAPLSTTNLTGYFVPIAGGSMTGDLYVPNLFAYNGVFASSSTITRVINPVSTTQVLYATSTITIGSVFSVVASTGGAVTLSSNPQITTTGATYGEVIQINGSSDTNTITLIDGNGLKLDGNVPFTLGLDDAIFFTYMPSGYWRENYRTNA